MENNSYHNNGTKFCKFCGNIVEVTDVVCPHCGSQIEELHSKPFIDVNRLNTGLGMKKQKMVAIILCCIGFVGVAGLHKFYENKYGWGIIYFLTGGFFGIGTIIDLLILLGKPEYYNV